MGLIVFHRFGEDLIDAGSALDVPGLDAKGAGQLHKVRVAW